MIVAKCINVSGKGFYIDWYRKKLPQTLSSGWQYSKPMVGIWNRSGMRRLTQGGHPLNRLHQGGQIYASAFVKASEALLGKEVPS